MSLQKIGLNFDALRNITPINVSVPQSAEEFAREIPAKANESSGGWWGFLSSMGLFVFLFWIFSDQSPNAWFKYSYARGLALASSFVSIIGIVCISIGWFVEVYHIVIFIAIAMVSTGFTFKEE